LDPGGATGGYLSCLELAGLISEHAALDTLGDLTAAASRMGAYQCERFFKEAPDLKLSEPASIAVALILPVNFFPKEAWQYPLGFAKSFPFLKSATFAPDWRLAVVMRLVKAAVGAQTGPDLLGEVGHLTELYHGDRELFQIPYLFLSADVRPVAVEVFLLKDVGALFLRRNVLSLYYAGVNKLLLDMYDAGDTDLLHAWTLSPGAKEVRETLDEYLSLSSFLSGQSRALFESRLPRKYIPRSGFAAPIWDIVNVTLTDPITSPS
jgi:hypothetical protein